MEVCEICANLWTLLYCLMLRRIQLLHGQIGLSYPLLTPRIGLAYLLLTPIIKSIWILIVINLL